MDLGSFLDKIQHDSNVKIEDKGFQKLQETRATQIKASQLLIFVEYNDLLNYCWLKINKV